MNRQGEITGVFVAEINRALQENGFRLQKGDARRVALTYLSGGGASSGPIDHERLSQAAKSCGVPMHGYVIEVPPIPDGAVDAAVDGVIKKLSRPDILDDILQGVVDEAVDGTRYRVVVDKTPWDLSTRAVSTEQQYDLSAYDMIGDFLEEPTGNTVATYVSGSGFAAESWEEQVIDMLRETVWDAINDTVHELWPHWQNEAGWSDEPETKSDILHEWAEMVYERLADQNMDELKLYDSLISVSFEEALTRFRPDALSRLKSDRERRSRIAGCLPELKDKVLFVLKEEVGKNQEQTDRAVAKTLLVTFGADECAALNAWLSDEDLQLPLPRKFRDEWTCRLRNCLEHIDPHTDAWHAPIASLWRFLTEAWLQDGRSWHVTSVELTQPFNTTVRAHTFSTDNWEWFLIWGLKNQESDVSIVLRRFEHLRDAATGFPLKTVCGLIIEGNRCIGLSADEMRKAATTDAITGNPMDQEPAVHYVDAHKLLAGWEWLNRL